MAGALPLAVSGVLAFTVPRGRSVAYAYATYALLMLAYTAINIPYSALMGVMSASSADTTAAISRAGPIAATR